MVVDIGLNTPIPTPRLFESRRNQEGLYRTVLACQLLNRETTAREPAETNERRDTAFTSTDRYGGRHDRVQIRILHGK